MVNQHRTHQRSFNPGSNVRRTLVLSLAFSLSGGAGAIRPYAASTVWPGVQSPQAEASTPTKQNPGSLTSGAGQLQPGKPIEQELAGDQSHTYQINLSAGQYLHLIVEQRGIDVVVLLSGPDGKKLAEVDRPNGSQGAEPVFWVAETTGGYRIEVRSLEKEVPAGRYEVSIAGLRAATLQDHNRVAAQRNFAEGNVLRRQGTAASGQMAVKKYEEAISLWQAAGERLEEAATLHNIGWVYDDLGETQKALDFYNRALPLRRASGERNGEAITLINIADTYSALGERQKALDYYNQALPIKRAVHDRSGEAYTLNKIGRVYTVLGEKQKALDYYNQALTLRRAVGDRSGEANTLNNIGLIYNDLGEKQKALDYYSQALTLRRAIGDRSGEATTLHNIGWVYYALGEKQKALDYYNQALPLRRAVGDRGPEATTLDNIGMVYDDLGEKHKALDYYNQALTLRRAIGDRSGEAHMLMDIGSAYDDLGEKQKALDYYSQALILQRAVGDRSGEATTLYYSGSVYYDLGEKHKALDYYNQALPIERAEGNLTNQATTLNSIGDVYISLGEKRKALDFFNQALSLYHTIGERSGEANALYNIGNVYSSLGETQKALDYFNQSLTIDRAAGNRGNQAITLDSIGLVYDDLGEKHKALDYYNQALPLHRAVGNRSGEATALYYLASVGRDLGHLSESRTQIEAALQIIESLRTKVVSRELRASYFATVQAEYGFYIDLLMQLHKQQPDQGNNATALQAVERARARSLLESLTEARADIRRGIDPVLLARERSLQQQLNKKAEARLKLFSSAETETQSAALRQEIDALTTELQQVQTQIRQVSPRYAALKQPEPLTVSQVQQVLDADTLLLEYALGSERSFLWAVTPTTVNSYELPKRREVEAAARRVYELLSAPNRGLRGETAEQRGLRLGQVTEQYTEAAAKLSQMLLGPVAGQLGKKRLVIAADGALHQIPFAALPDPTTSNKSVPIILADKWRIVFPKVRQSSNFVAAEPQTLPSFIPLLAEHEIITLPSASTLAVLRRELAGRKPAPKMLAVLADPVFTKDDVRFKASARKADDQKTEQSLKGIANERVVRLLVAGSDDNKGDLRIKRLRFTRQEAERLMTLVAPGTGMKALDFTASRRTVESGGLSQYRYIHFATHGLADSERPEFSTILLSLFDEQGRPQDGFLRAHEIYNLNLPAELVVLSACETGLGTQIRGEGLVGLTRGFMYAGAARVVVSLWSVNDRATAELMEKFYRKMLREGERPAAALRAAQIEMWQSRQWSAPYYWAAFTLQGEWR